MQIGFELDSFPEETGGYNVTARTEGTLRVLLDTRLFLETSGILLVELAVVLYKWLRATQSHPRDFYYASMDFEEEPILALNYDAASEQYVPASVWAEGASRSVSPPLAQAAAEEFLAQLRQELKARYGFDLDPVLEAALEDDRQ